MLSPFGFSILSGAGLIHAPKEPKTIQVHSTTRTLATNEGIDLSNVLAKNETISDKGPIYIIITESDGSLTGEFISLSKVKLGDDKKEILPTAENAWADKLGEKGQANVFVDYYINRTEANTYEMQIDGENFAGNYYVEADTLFRRKSDGRDLPASLTFPNVKIQSNFTFSMASTGDPSTSRYVGVAI